MNNQLVKAENNGALIASPIDREAAKNLLPGERKFIEAALQPKINDQPAEAVVLLFNAIITQAYTRAGFKMPDAVTLALYAREFYEALLEKYPRVTIPEVREALKEGVYGEFGEFTGLNPKTFIQFIKGYLFTKDRKEALRQFESKRDYLNATKDLSPQEREAHGKEFVNMLFEDHLSGKLQADFVPSFIYDFLEAQGKMKLSLEAKRAISERAKGYFLRLKSSRRYKGNPRSVGDELAAYIQSRDEELTVRNISKQFAVVDFFDACKFNGTKTIFPNPKLLC
jgi:hypothetical protein